MIRYLVLIPIMSLLIQASSYGQAKPKFSGDLSKFKEEVTSYLGPNLTPEQTGAVGLFFARWDSSGFSSENMTSVSLISAKLAARNIRPVPHFIDFLKALTDFSVVSEGKGLSDWMKGLERMITLSGLNNDFLARHFRNSSSTLKTNTIYEQGNVSWRIKEKTSGFVYDTLLKIKLDNVTLLARTGKDSTEIYNVTGTFFPESASITGSYAKITWEKAGYERDKVFAEMRSYTLNLTRTSFSSDSALLTHSTYFKEPVYGKLSDQATSYPSPDKAAFPKFETYAKSFRIENLYKGVNYEGGLTLDGASVKGSGTRIMPAKIQLYRNDTLYFGVRSQNFNFTRAGIVSQEASATLYMDADSIYHSSLGFSYNTETRNVNLLRNNNPVSKSPYYNSFHGLDMYFENLSWNMNDSKVFLTRARGASLGVAKFESESFFNTVSFERLAGIDDYHPLYRLRQFANWFYSNTFPVSEFAKWLKRPEDAVTGLCIDLTNKGFLFYDRANNEVTIKQKADDYMAANLRKIDYDVMSIVSETNAPLDNAILDLKSYKLTVNGVPGVFLSDSQKVAIYPYNNRVTIGKNRSLEFDGVVEAGLFTIFGHNFMFSYDTFKIRLHKIDSIRIAVETDRRDKLGNPIIEEVDNLIQLATAELYIDDPRNKSGLKSLKQYPIINTVANSYIFYDKIPGMEGVYSQGDFYFEIDPFTYENIDHYMSEDLNLSGTFHGGKVLKPSRQYLTIQEDNSLGFRQNIPETGVEVFGGKGKIYNELQMNNRGLNSAGSLRRLTSVAESEEFRFYPDSMTAVAKKYVLNPDPTGKFPELSSTDMKVTWYASSDEWKTQNPKGKPVSMFGNDTRFDGTLVLSPSQLKGKGITDMSDSRILSDGFSFGGHIIKADTSDYNLKTKQGDGLAFIAENVNATIDFSLQQSRFSLNTDSSVVKFPEIQYICKMTDFQYNMKSRVLSMEQKGKSSSKLMQPSELLKLSFAALDKPTFISTNNQSDTIAFSSWKGSYNLEGEFVEAENINYIHIADALIQPEEGKITIGKRARIKPLQNAVLAVNNRHIIHSAQVMIETSKKYMGSGIYDYIDENKTVQQINLPDIVVDTATTTAKGYIPVTQKFMLSPAFTYSGDVTLSARADNLSYTGAAGIVQSCGIKSYPIKFKASVDPKMVMIPYPEKPRDINDNLIFSGSFLNIDSAHIYPAFLSPRKSWSDAQIVVSEGVLYYEKETGRYKIATKEKLADPSGPGPMVSYDKNYCFISGEGKLNLGTNFDLVNMALAGKVMHGIDSSKMTLEAILALDFHFSQEALKMMSDEIRAIPTLRAVNLNTDLNNKGMIQLLGPSAAKQINEELGLFGTLRSMPKEYTYELLLNDLKLKWNQATSSFRSEGKIGIGFIGSQPVNVYVDGYVEIQRRRSGDLIDIYLKADNSTWFYFSYFKGVMMSQAGNLAYNSLISGIKQNDRKDPRATNRQPYSYMISVEDRLPRFLRRMQSNDIPEDR